MADLPLTDTPLRVGQRRLDSKYDTIDETEQAIAEVRAQILDLKKSSNSS